MPNPSAAPIPHLRIREGALRLRIARASAWVLALALAVPASAQQTPTSTKQATARRVPARTIRVDGRLDEALWEQATPITDLVQKEPVEGAPPSDRTEIRFLYDDDALYVGARMYSGGPIQAPMSRRDNVQQADYLLISLDGYLDRRTAYSFGVTASGVRLDHYHPADDEENIEVEFDPVWEASTTVDDQGWTAEMWIPFSQLRFNDLEQQRWGLNVHRWIPSRNEDDYWVAIPRTERGWASRFGELRGIGGIESSRRVEFLPYVAGGSTVTGDRDTGDPFDDGRNLEWRVGGDVKMGVGPNLTLEATVNPDFGQVESDPAVVNLTASEIFFDERRPFFIEGSRLIAGAALGYFNSRRIGAPPMGPAPGDHVDYPRNTTILGAAKLTGRTPSGFSVAALGAVTGQEHARAFDVGSGQFSRLRVAPRTGWFAGRAQQELDAAGSTASVMLAGVRRDLPAGDPLAALMNRSAVTLGAETFQRLGGGEYEVMVNVGMSHVRGDPAGILRVQRATPRYFQRPDASHVRVDSTRTAMTGWKTQINADKVGGEHWLGELYLAVESPDLEFNDIGRLISGDGIQTRAGLTYRETTPGPRLRSYRFSLTQGSEWTFGRDRQRTSLTGNANLTWNNFWTTTASVRVGFRSQDLRLTRGGPSMGTPLGWSSNLRVESPGSAQTRWNARLVYGRDELDGWNGEVSGGVSLQPSPQLQLSLQPSYEREVNPQQYVKTETVGGEATYGSRYVFAFVDRTTLSTQVRVGFTLKPDLNLDVYAEPFAASGRFYGFGELTAPRSRVLRRYGTGGTTVEPLTNGDLLVRDGADTFLVPDPSFNRRSFRSTSVLRWEWRPGSTLYLVWQQDRSADEDVGYRAALGDMFGSVSSTGDNFFAIKASFWLPR